MRLPFFALTALALVLAAGAPARVARAAEPAPAIAFTFDDGLDPAAEPAAARWNAEILAALSRSGVKAMLFPAGRTGGTPGGLALTRAWGDSGHAIGNHTYSHRNLGSARMTVDEFGADVMRADSLFRVLPGFTPMLRFPYLKEGESAEKRDAFRAWMRAHGYRPAPVSVDASDWWYSTRWRELERAGRAADLPRLRDAYVAHLWDRACYYDSLARAVLGRSPRHVLLLHTNAINAACVGDVIAHFRAHGWNVIAPAEAFADPLYASEPAAVPAGESIVWSHARVAGAKGLRYPAEDGEYEAPRLARLGL